MVKYGYTNAFLSPIDWYITVWLPFCTLKSTGTLKYGYPAALSFQIDCHVRILLPYCTFKSIGTLQYGYSATLVTLLHSLLSSMFILKTSLIQEYRVLSSVK